jgi:CheY-like chemotaxis protein
MKQRILVIDPDAMVRHAVRRLAEPLGVHVEEADSNRGLVDRVRRSDVSLVLLDLDADTEGSFAAADELKDHPETADVQVLALSARLDSGKTAGATEHAFEDFLGKPVQEKELVPLLRFHLDLPHGINDAHPL